MIPYPTLLEENRLWNSGHEFVIGMDEVGRGAFAGPVVTAGVILPKVFVDTEGIHDSKLLTAKKRTQLDPYIRQHALQFQIAEVSVEIINKIGIHKATCEAFEQVLKKLYEKIPKKNSFVLLDGRALANLCCGIKGQKAIVKGDQKSLSIAAASIIAKVYRDKRMSELESVYPNYAFAKHKGYGTRYHQDAIRKFGLTDIHRKSFDLSAYTVAHLA